MLEKIEAYKLDAERYLAEFRKLSDAMDAELAWYTDEIQREWDDVEPDQGDCGDQDARVQ